jgi:predicted TIM-barrel fold metal-dependent hydrolase
MDLSVVAVSLKQKAIMDEARSRLQDRIMFGSDYPFITPERWFSDFDKLEDFSPEVRRKILFGNASRVLGFKGDSS